MKKLKPYLRKLLYVSGLILMVSLLFFLNARQHHDLCDSIDIEIKAPRERELISEDMVYALLETWYPGGLIGLELNQIDIHDIEERLNEYKAVESSQVSFDLKGVLKIQIDQKLPILRVYQGAEQSYYLDNKFRKISSNQLQTARVPIATNIKSEAMIKKVYTLSTYVNENEFMKALTEQIFVGNDGDLILIPKIFQQEIIIGDTSDLNIKFDKLKTFYQKGLNNVGWEKYKTLNLKYAKLVVCK